MKWYKILMLAALVAAGLPTLRALADWCASQSRMGRHGGHVCTERSGPLASVEGTAEAGTKPLTAEEECAYVTRFADECTPYRDVSPQCVEYVARAVKCDPSRHYDYEGITIWTDHRSHVRVVDGVAQTLPPRTCGEVIRQIQDECLSEQTTTCKPRDGYIQSWCGMLEQESKEVCGLSNSECETVHGWCVNAPMPCDPERIKLRTRLCNDFKKWCVPKHGDLTPMRQDADSLAEWCTAPTGGFVESEAHAGKSVCQTSPKAAYIAGAESDARLAGGVEPRDPCEEARKYWRWVCGHEKASIRRYCETARQWRDEACGGPPGLTRAADVLASVLGAAMGEGEAHAASRPMKCDTAVTLADSEYCKKDPKRDACKEARAGGGVDMSGSALCDAACIPRRLRLLVQGRDLYPEQAARMVGAVSRRGMAGLRRGAAPNGTPLSSAAEHREAR